MLTRMELVYRSKYRCSRTPAIFTTGGYYFTVDNRQYHFDFEDMEAGTRLEDGFLYINVLQKNLDESLLNGWTMSELSDALCKAKKEDFNDIFYECFADADEKQLITLEPVSITFYDFSAEGTGKPIEVGGEGFTNLVEEIATGCI